MRNVKKLLEMLSNYKNIKLLKGEFLKQPCAYVKKGKIEAFILYKKRLRDNNNPKTEETEIAVFYDNKNNSSGGAYGIFVKDMKDEEIIEEMMKNIFKEEPIISNKQMSIFDFI